MPFRLFKRDIFKMYNKNIQLTPEINIMLYVNNTSIKKRKRIQLRRIISAINKHFTENQKQINMLEGTKF